MIRPEPPSGWSRFLPASTFARFMLATVLVGVVTAGAAILLSRWIGSHIIHDLQEETGYTVLRNTVEMVSRSQIAVEELRTQAFAEHKTALENINGYTQSILDSYRAEARSGAMSQAEAESKAFHRLNSLGFRQGGSIFVIDGHNRLTVHSQRVFRGLNLDSFQDLDGRYVLRELEKTAKQAPPGESSFLVYLWPQEVSGELESRLAAVRYYKPWGVTIGADMSLSRVETALKEKSLANENELRARLHEVTIGGAGYLFIFDEDCNTIAHPSLAGTNIGNLKVPGSGANLCQTLKDTAERPWGENKLYYDWDMPGDRGHFTHPKVSWVTREPTTGWFVAASAYIEDMEGSLPDFMLSIFIPSLISIIVLGLALAVLLKNLLRPVSGLIRACQRVEQGRLDASAPEDGSGEMGFLCRHFNSMIDALRQSRKKEQKRQAQLEKLNRNLEKTVAVRTRALTRKAHKLEEANARLRELDEMKSTFLSSVSHEFRTPLTSILGFAKLISKDFTRNFGELAAADEKLAKAGRRLVENVTVISSEGERLTRLINDFLDLAKIESGRLEWNDSEFALSRVVENSLAALSTLMRSKPGVCLHLSVPDDLPPIRADRDRITQVIINLMGNALKFTDKGDINVSACSREDVIQMRIADSGSGVPRGELLNIFDKFHQTPTTDTLLDKPRGTGLGLAICQNIISRYDGIIWAESQPERGTELIFELPAIPSRTSDEEPESEPCLRQLPLRLESPTPLILVVDDDPSIRTYLSRIFEENSFSVITARDGSEAVELAAAHKPALVTMDLMMPVMDGKTAISKIRANPELSGLPIVVVSALSDPGAGGGDAVLGKPVDEERLIRTVRSLLSLSGDHTGPCLVITSDGKPRPGAYFTPYGSIATYCTKNGLRSHLDDGFTGTVLIPTSVGLDLQELGDLAELAGRRELQVVLIPDPAATGH